MEKQKSTEIQKKAPLLQRLFKFAHGYEKYTYLSLVLSAISTICALFVAVFVWKGADIAIYSYPNYNIIEIRKYAYFALASVFFAIFIYAVALLCSHKAAFRIASNMRTETLKHLMQLPLGYFTNTGSGKIKRTIDDSATATENYLAHQLPDLIGSFASVIVVLILLFSFNIKLGFASLVPVVLSFAVLSLSMMNGYKERITAYQNAIEKMNNEAIEYIRAIPVVKTFAQSIFSFKKFYEIIDEYKVFVQDVSKGMRLGMVLYQALTVSIFSFLIVFACLFIVSADNTKEFFSHAIFYLFFSSTLTVLLMRIMWTSQVSILAEDALDRIEKLLNEKVLPQSENPKEPKNFDIAINNVSFSYPNSTKKALENINIEIKQGQTIALVGTSGGGKSTIASLIARFFDVDNGSITIGGVDVRDISEEKLMQNISFVFQQTSLYKESILDNVREANPQATLKEIEQALKQAQCEDILEKVSLHTSIGAKGTYLSGGEQQRIAIARALVKDAPIILLDEATAFADPENEYKIRLAFEELTKNKSVLMIAHRLSTIENADYIYVIEDGKVLEQGTHKELIEKKQEYASLWDEYNQTLSWA